MYGYGAYPAGGGGGGGGVPTTAVDALDVEEGVFDWSPAFALDNACSISSAVSPLVSKNATRFANGDFWTFGSLRKRTAFWIMSSLGRVVLLMFAATSGLK